MKLASIFFGIGALAAATAAPAATLLYLNFDQAATGTYTNGTAYSPGSTEVAARLINADAGGFSFAFRAYDTAANLGPTIGPLPGGLANPSVAQGGKALILDNTGGRHEGMTVTATNGVLPQDITIEAVWYTVDAAATGNTVGIQSIIGDEWPAGETAHLFIRTVGPNRMDWWTNRGDSNSERVQLTTTPSVVANTLYHDVLVLDYNEATPASSQILAYRNGTLVGTSTYNAAGNGVSLFGVGFNNGVVGEESRSWAIGMALGAPVNGSDDRGLRGGVDAVAISTGALTPGNFVLPAGNIDLTPVEGSWNMYE